MPGSGTGRTIQNVRRRALEHSLRAGAMFSGKSTYLANMGEGLHSILSSAKRKRE